MNCDVLILPFQVLWARVWDSAEYPTASGSRLVRWDGGRGEAGGVGGEFFAPHVAEICGSTRHPSSISTKQDVTQDSCRLATSGILRISCTKNMLWVPERCLGYYYLKWPDKPDRVCMCAATDPPYGSVITALNRCLGLTKFNLGPIQKIFWKHKHVPGPCTHIHTHEECCFLCRGFYTISTEHYALVLNTVSACSFSNKCKKQILALVVLFLLIHPFFFFFPSPAIWVSTIRDRIHLN